MKEEFERIAIMIRTGASEKTLWNVLEKSYQSGKINDRVFCVLSDMIVEKFNK